MARIIGRFAKGASNDLRKVVVLSLFAEKAYVSTFFAAKRACNNGFDVAKAFDAVVT